MSYILEAILAKPAQLVDKKIGERAYVAAAFLLALGASLPTQADVPVDCQVDASNPVSFVGTVEPCKDLLVISQADFDAVGSASRSNELTRDDGNGQFSVTHGSETYGVAEWYTGNISDMAGYFYSTAIGDGTVVGDISNWDTSQVTDMSLMFRTSGSFNQNLGAWDVSKVKTMRDMFGYASAFQGNGLSNWDTSSVEDMEDMFRITDNFNADISGWDVSNVTAMKAMFRKANAFNVDIGGWDVRNVGDTSYMFLDNAIFDQDIGGWFVTNVTDMAGMFKGAAEFDRDIGGWAVSNVTSMTEMFNESAKFNQDLSQWNVSHFDSEPRDFSENANSDWLSNSAYQPKWGQTSSIDPSVLFSETNVSISKGSTTTVGVVLKTEPTADVVITLGSDNAAVTVVAETGGGESLTFTPENWNQSQNVTITAVDDDKSTSETGVLASFTPGGASEYASLGAQTVTVDVADTDTNDPAAFELTLVGSTDGTVSLDEGTTTTVGVVLKTEPTADVVITLGSDNAAVTVVAETGGGESLTFTPGNWDQSQNVTITAVVDDNSTSETGVAASFTPGGASEYANLGAQTVTVDVADTDTAAFELSVELTDGKVSLDEGSSTTVGVVLKTEPTADVVITLGSNNAAVTVVAETGGGESLTFTPENWDQSQNVTITAVNDDNSTSETGVAATFTPSGASEYASLPAQTVTVEVSDDEAPSLIVSGEDLSDGELTVTEGSSSPVDVALATEPSASVTVTVSVPTDDPATVSNDGGETSSNSVALTFTASDYSTPQAVTIITADNSTVGAAAATLTLATASTDSDYSAVADQTVAVTIADDESAELVTNVATLTMDEGATATFTLALGGEPSSEVSVALASNKSALRLAEASLTFDETNWSVPQTLTLTAPENATLGNATAEVSLTATGAEFEGVSAEVVVQIVDNDYQPPSEDTGARVSSIATSDVMGTQLGNLISDAVSGGISSARSRRGEQPWRTRRTLLGQGSADYNPEAYNRLQVLSAREGEDGFTLVDWFSVGLSQASLDSSLSGDGVFAYAMAGRELTKTESSVGGLLYGIETSSWDYEEETDVDRTGFSFGYYRAQERDGLTFSGSAIYTLTLNDFVSAIDATGDATSHRLIFRGSLSGERAFDRMPGTLKPYVNLMYATESLDSFTFSDGTSSDSSSTQLGRLGLGLEYATSPTASGNRFLVRGELSQVFGTDSVTLSDGEVYSPNEDPVGSITFGWLTRPNADTSARIELTFDELGNSDAEELRLDGTIDRKF